jgi:DNA-binding response OmpR family regulator/anti-sigma regulatory factor (Ser/Thr protein kinase)
MKTRFFTNISHEFRTPLTLILSPLESLLSDSGLSWKMSEHIKGIQKNARRLLRLINQLLDISAIESDHLKLKVSKGDVAGHVREIASLFRWPANQRNIAYDFQTDAAEYTCFFDGDKIEKICYNLISNAFKYTPNGGSIHIQLTTSDADFDSNYKGFMRIIVKDSGFGIKKEEQEKIFDPFYRSEFTENFQKGGSGIGLGLVRGLVNAYHGQVNIRSEEGEGTEFTVYLPVKKTFFREHEIDPTIRKDTQITFDIYDLEHTLPEGTDRDFDDQGGKEHVDSKPYLLIVEDNQELRTHLADHFQTDYCVAEASNGEKALEFVGDNIPDLIISDIRMPEMDGIDFCKKLKSAEKTSHIPIILLTAKAGEQDRYEGLSIGADAYITKPFEVKILDATVKNLIDQRKQLKDKYSKSIMVEPTEISITSLDEKFLKKAIAIVEENIANPEYSVDTFSKDIGMSRSHLHRKFVGLTGHSPSGFIRTLRMKRSAQLLTKGQLTVSEILYKVGIKSRSYFTKSFKDQFGFSPTEFVAKHKTDNKKFTIPD